MKPVKQKGIGLLEVLVSLFILAVGIVALIKFQGLYARQGILTKQGASALNLAQKKIEALRHFETLSSQSGIVAYDDIASGTEAINKPSAQYTLQWGVNDNTDPGYKTVDVTVSWTDAEGKSRSVRLSSIIGRIDPVLSGEIKTTGGGRLMP